MSDDFATYRRVPLEVFNDGNIELIDELFSDDYVERVPLPPGFPEGREAVKLFVSALRTAFPDFHYEIVMQSQDGDMHWGMIRASGTMEGDFMGMPASHKSATWDEVHIGRFVDGKIAEHWAVIDQLAMLTQLGFVTPPGG